MADVERSPSHCRKPRRVPDDKYFGGYILDPCQIFATIRQCMAMDFVALGASILWTLTDTRILTMARITIQHSGEAPLDIVMFINFKPPRILFFGSRVWLDPH